MYASVILRYKYYRMEGSKTYNPFEIKFQRKRLYKKIKCMWLGRFWFIKKLINSDWQDTNNGIWHKLTSGYLGILASLPSICHSVVDVFAPPKTEASSHREQRAVWPLNSYSLPLILVLHQQLVYGKKQYGSSRLQKVLSFIPRLSLTEFCNQQQARYGTSSEF